MKNKIFADFFSFEALESFLKMKIFLIISYKNELSLKINPFYAQQLRFLSDLVSTKFYCVKCVKTNFHFLMFSSTSGVEILFIG